MQEDANFHEHHCHTISKLTYFNMHYLCACTTFYYNLSKEKVVGGGALIIMHKVKQVLCMYFPENCGVKVVLCAGLFDIQENGVVYT